MAPHWPAPPFPTDPHPCKIKRRGVFISSFCVVCIGKWYPLCYLLEPKNLPDGPGTARAHAAPYEYRMTNE